MIPFQYIRPTSVKATVEALKKNPSAQLIAGGTNLVDLMKRGVSAPEMLIDINHLPLKKIEQLKNGLQLGALALNSEVSENELVLKNFPLLALALKAGASQQLRNMATVGGNMMQRTRCTYFYDTEMPCNKRVPGSGCGAMKGYNRMSAIFGTSDSCIAVHPSDMCVALAALDAEVIIQKAKGGERRIAFTEFHRLPGNTPEQDNTLQKGELIVGIVLPANRLQQHVAYLKVRDRASYAFALVSVAAALEISNNKIVTARLAMGGVAHKPWRLYEAEKMLKGMPAEQASFEAVAKIAMQDAKTFGHNDFKLRLAPKTIVEALKQAAGIS